MQLTKSTEAEILQAYHHFWAANLSADMKTFASYLVDDFSIFGSAVGEIFFSKQDAVKFYTATADQMPGKAELRNRNISLQPVDNNSVVARELSDLYILMGADWTFYGHARISCVITYINNQWKAVHQHASFPDHRTEEGQQIAAEKIEKENLELREAVQRRTVELEKKNRELEIENSLERVRTVAISMHRADDLLNVCQVFFTELLSLGFTNVRNTLIHIFNDEKGYYYDHDYSDFTGGKTSMIPYKGHAKMEAFLEQIRSSADAFAEVVFDGSELAEWKAFRELSNQIKDPRLDVTTVLYYYFYSIGEGNIGISTFTPINQHQLEILKRFRNVFEFSYRRYRDIEKAEAQAKEAKVEAALEKVRSRTLAMQKSDELAETAAVLFQQLISLGIEPNRLYIILIKEHIPEMESWLTDEDGSKLNVGFTGNYNNNRTLFKMYDGWRQKKKSLVIDMQGDELQEYFHYLHNELNVPFKGGLEQKRRIQHLAYFNHGLIGMASPEEQPEGTLQLLERFAAVFNLTFTRFNDLKIAEAHAAQAEQDLIEVKAARQKAEDTLTELRATQKQLVQSEKMASLGELTAGIAHEIQNPLNFVNNFSEVSSELIDEMIEEATKGNFDDVRTIAGDVKQNLQKIAHHGKRADGIVKGMLQHSRTSSGQKEPTDINALCEEYLRLAYHGLRAKEKSFNATLQTNFDETIGPINIIPQDIGRVILNLITNAFFAVGEKQKSGIANFEPTVSVATKKLADKIQVTVNDNGNGIPPTIVDKIFQPFFTTKPTGQGTGLGLSMSYDIVTKGHKGELKVETREGAGTSFSIILPVT